MSRKFEYVIMFDSQGEARVELDEPIIRCRDCANYRKEVRGLAEGHYCKFFDMTNPPSDGFCYWAEDRAEFE